MVLYVDDDFQDWSNLEIDIWELRQQGQYIRLIVDKPIPYSILWAISYDANNFIQINVNMFKPFDKWVPNLAHAAERCGLFFVLTLHPIVPEFVKAYQVIEILDTIRMMPHCLVMLKFAEFNNSGRLSNRKHLNLNGKVISKEHVYEYKKHQWKCTEWYVTNFMSIIQSYAISQQMNVQICGGLS